MLKVIGLYDWTRNLPPDVRAEVEAALQLRSVPDGEYIFHIGDIPDACYRIKSGQIEVQNFTDSGKQFTIIELFDGDCFGESSLIENLPRCNNAMSVGETLLQTLPKRAFLTLYRQHAEISRAITHNLSNRLRNALSLVQGASLFTLRERLISLIARLAASRGVDIDGVTILDNVSHEKLANMLGASRQAVSRELKALEMEGLLHLKYGKMHIPDLRTIVAMYEDMMSAELLSPEYPPRTSGGQHRKAG